MKSDWMRYAGEAIGYDVWYEIITRSESVQAAGARLGLSRSHVLALHLYSWGDRKGTDPFALINGHLRGLSPCTGVTALFVFKIKEELQDALSQLPRHRSPVYRSTDLGYRRPLAALGQLGLTIGMEMRDPGFLSASPDPMLFRNKDLLLLDGHSGRDISVVSAFPHEREVIFAPDTIFSLRHVEAIGDGLLLHLVE